jgi:hypothetical protein
MLSRLSVWILCVAYLATQVVAGGLQAGYERDFFWTAYNIAYDVYGPKQKFMYPQEKGGKTYKATGPDGRHTWAEFIDRISNREVSFRDKKYLPRLCLSPQRIHELLAAKRDSVLYRS